MDEFKPVLTDAQIVELLYASGPNSLLIQIARKVERAAIEAYERQRESADATFDLWQHDMVVASASGPRDKALAEIKHYAALYSQEGPVQVEEVIRIPLDAP